MDAYIWILKLVPALCILYWALAAGAVMVTVLPVPVPTAFRRTVELSAARGKLWLVRPKTLGSIEDAAVPQRWFSHFYIVGSAANGALLLWLTGGSLLLHPTSKEAASVCAMAAFQIHLVRRAVETLAVMVYPPDAMMHLIAYIFGLSYYLAVPVSLIPPAVFQETRLEALFHLPQLKQSTAVLPKYWSTAAASAPWSTYLGVLIFLGGNFLQWSSHRILGQLQSQQLGVKPSLPASTAPEKAYSIPRGGLFELVSCPHYLAEIIIYLGLLLLTQGSLVAWLMNVWVVFNLVLAAKATHSWYLKRFDDYPKSRRSLVPYIY